MKSFMKYNYILSIILLMVALNTHAQFPQQMQQLDELFSWEVVLEESTVAQDQVGAIVATFSIADEHFTYYDQTSLSVEAVEGITFGEPEKPEPITQEDPTDDNKEKQVYVGENTFRIPFKVESIADIGSKTINVQVKHQGCSQTVCYFPQQKQIELELNVTEGTGETEELLITTSTQETVPPDAENSFATQRAESQGDFLQTNSIAGLLLALLALFGLGIATAATPCVYPLIPITISILGAKEAKNIFQSFLLAATYVMGIVIMYSALGFFAASTGAVFGQFMSNPWVIGTLAAIFIAMGFSMLGAFELQIPSSVQSKFFAAGGKGYGSAFFMGLFSGIVAAPCTGPVLVVLLAYVAQQGQQFQGLVYLFTYALGLGFPFLILGTYSGLIHKMPKSGSWMEHVKSVFGIIMFAVALYFLKDAFKVFRFPLSDTIMTYLVWSIALVAGLAIGAVHLSFHNPNLMVRLRKGIGVLLASLALYVIAGSMTLPVKANFNWVYNLEEGLTMAQDENRPVMIDFYADWCTVCKDIEKYTFNTPEVEEAMKRFVTIKVDLTNNTEENQKIQQEYSIPGLPYIVFYSSDHEILFNKTITGMIHKEEFLEHIAEIE